MLDLLGINKEKRLEDIIIKGDIVEAQNLCKEAWEKENIPSFKFWQLTIEGKSKDALKFAKDHVMVRDSPLGIYLAHRYCPEDMTEFLNYRLTNTDGEKKRLIDSSLFLACKLGDIDFAKRMLHLGANPKIHYHQAFKNSCDGGHLEIVKLLVLDYDVNPTCEDGYGIKSAAQSQSMELLEFLGSKDTIVPMSTHEITTLLKEDKFKSLEWICRKQTKPPAYTDGYASLHFNFANPKDCEKLLISYIQYGIENFPNQYREKIKNILEWLPLSYLKTLSNRESPTIAESKELCSLCRAVFNKKTAKETLEKISKELAEESQII